MRIICVAALVMISLRSVGQDKHDNTIIVHGSVEYKRLTNALLDNGFTVITSDTNTVVTNKKNLGGFSLVNYQINKRDSITIFKGFTSGTMFHKPYSFPLDNTWGSDRAGFKLMTKIAASFGFPITYLSVK